MSNQKELKKRTLSYGANSLFITILVIALVGVADFLVYQYPQKADLTKNKIHSFSDESTKVMKSLKSDLKADFYGDFGSREKYRPIFDNYKKISNKFKFEQIDPSKEPSRTKAAGVKRQDTLVLTYMDKTAKVEDVSEEKVTNAIIKLTKEGKQIYCMILGHGEASISDNGQSGIAVVKKGFEDQSYETKEITLSQEKAIPADCTAIAMVGVNKALFPAEIKILSDYLNNGGRAVIAFDAVITKDDPTKEFREYLKTWGFEIKSGLIIDPSSQTGGIAIATQFNPDSPITKDWKQIAALPFTRPVELTSAVPAGLKTTWLAKTSEKAWDEMDMNSLAKGVQYDKGVDIAGPLTVAAVSSGRSKDSKASRETRLVVFGSSQFANNNYSRFSGNLDFFLNAASWAVEDESMISIRAKEEENGKIELTQNEGILIFWVSVVLIPLAIAIFGIVIWVKRKKL